MFKSLKFFTIWFIQLNLILFTTIPPILIIFKTPFSLLKHNQVQSISYNDFLILCPTCHRLIHRQDNISNLDELKKILTNH